MGRIYNFTYLKHQSIVIFLNMVQKCDIRKEKTSIHVKHQKNDKI
jgi:hypothetical protein